MRAPKVPILLIVLLAMFVGTLLAWQRRTTEHLKSEIASRRTEAETKARLLAEQQRLEAAQLSPEDMEKLRRERAAISALRAEIETMKRRSETSARTTTMHSSGGSSAASRDPSFRDGLVSANFWKNAGRSTPDAAFETALWAAAGGDVEALAGLLLFERETRIKAEGIFTRLPPALQLEIGTPERLIALMVAKDAPLGGAQIVAETPTANGSQLRTLLVDEKGGSKQVQLSLRSEAAGWRFIVPPRAVEKYASQLQASAAKR